MDIFCSRRANITRLQSGLGLPVRDLFGPAEQPSDKQRRDEYWTSLPFVGDNLVRRKITYKELRKLGAFDSKDRLGRGQNFFWLWRSTIARYDSHCRIWQRWLLGLLKKWRMWDIPIAPAKWPSRDGGEPVNGPRHQAEKPWWDGFSEYDFYLKCEYAERCKELCHVDINKRWLQFDASCDGLIETLARATDTDVQ